MIPYYEKTKGIDERAFLNKNSVHFAKKDSQLLAYDLGCGVGNDTAFLVKHGYSVVAVDISEDAFEYMNQKYGNMRNVEQVLSSLEKLSFKKNHLVNASLVLPFIHKDYFDQLLSNIVNSLEPGGLFIGSFFGPRDGWAKKTITKSAADIQKYFKGFKLIDLYESESNYESVGGLKKHWHIINVVYKKI